MAIEAPNARAPENMIFWRTRAEQLQTALDTRVVIEQAKGILAERFRIDVADAFVLLRAAARSRRIKIHDLAAQVVAAPSTPEPVLHALKRENGARARPLRGLD